MRKQRGGRIAVVALVGVLTTTSCAGSDSGDAVQGTPTVTVERPTTADSPDSVPQTTSPPTSLPTSPPTSPPPTSPETTPTTTEAPEPPARSTPLADVIDEITVTPPDDLEGEAFATWLFEQLPVQTLAVGSSAGSVYTVVDGDVRAVETGDAGVSSADGRYLTIFSGRATEPNTRFVAFDGTEVCSVAAIGRRVVQTEPELIVQASVQSSSQRSRLIYPHPYDYVCSTGERREIVPLLVSAPDFWQESHAVYRVGDREFLGKLLPNSAPTTNEQGVRIDGRDQTSHHEFTDDGSVLVHATQTLLDPDVSRVQARDTTSGELLWEVSLEGGVDEIAATRTSIVFAATDATGFDGIVVVDLASGRPTTAIPTPRRFIGAS